MFLIDSQVTKVLRYCVPVLTFPLGAGGEACVTPTMPSPALRGAHHAPESHAEAGRLAGRRERGPAMALALALALAVHARCYAGTPATWSR